MTLRCSELKENQEVVFKIYSDIYDRKIYEMGTVLFVDNERKRVCVSWLEGYKNYTHGIPFYDMVAVADENGEMMKFDNISGKSILLTAE